MAMTAEDADDPRLQNAVLRYNIVRQSPDKPSPNMFYIHPESGNIVTVISPTLLDRETLPTTQYELEIVAQDMKGRDVGLTGTATATITITDKNDHAPEFTHSLFPPEGSMVLPFGASSRWGAAVHVPGWPTWLSPDCFRS
ncbi:hypothetical protein DPEC_G00215060 [Dallia pectoralis]|uniref:Uncharacterized protein n=1 Tax=Dallia pectoralis TaxID=75939 RepID=A0ACC2G287_DALPE|nr:hypothetical protein DPEC_G00215060 [Dallia pectoralis]